MNEKINQYQQKLFNKLFSTLPAVKQMNHEKSILNLDKPITHYYFFHNKKFWFAKGETNDKFIYIFGKNPLESGIGESDATIIIDFDKNIQFNKNSLGLFSIENSEIHILINDALLNQRYEFFNTGDFQVKRYTSINDKFSANVFDLGSINDDFIKNIEKFIELSPKINKLSTIPENTQKDKLIKTSQNSAKQNSNSQVKTNTIKNTVDIRDLPLPKLTKKKMNLFLNALESGKTHEEACIIARVNPEKIEKWYKFGKKGDENFIPFYVKYKPFYPKNVERLEKMETFLDALKKDSNIDNALKKSGLDISKVKAWYNLGKKNDDDYKDFYIACKLVLPNGIPGNETNKIVNNEELINEFIELINGGKTNEEAIKQLKIPKFKIKNWVNQGKLGNAKYVNFYNAYMIEIEKEKQKKKAKKQKKLLEQQKNKEPTKIKSHEKISDKASSSKSNDRICEICGRKLNKKTKNYICKRCLRKQYASKILLKLLNSIEPEKPFKKEDLKVLGLQNIQITDYIWTLQEFNLISEKNNKLQLKNMEELEAFIKESGLEIEEIPQNETKVKLNKTCKTCGQTLEISKFFTSKTNPDGFEDNCKECKKSINTADYLKEILEFIEYDSEFSEDDLKPHFKSPFQLQAKIWALLDKNLVKKNFETDTYVLTDEKTAKEFLDKYYEEKTVNEAKIPSEEESPQTLDYYTNEDQRKIVLKSISEGKSRKEAAKIANIPLYKITHWYNEGRQGFGEENVNFYNQLKGLEKINETNEKRDYKDKAINRKIFLDNLKNGKTKEESALNADITLSLVDEWYLKGKNNEEPYREFYDKYFKIENNEEEVKIQKLEKTDQFGNQKTINQMNLILESLLNGKSEKEAIEEANVSENNYRYWLNRGKQEFGDLYIQFYHNVNKIKLNKSENENISKKPLKDTDMKESIWAPLPDEYEESFKSTKTNKTGIAWVNRTGSQWTYSRQIDGKPITISAETIEELHKKVIGNNLIWGIRDYEKAKKIIDASNNLEVPKKDNKSNIEIIKENNEIDPDIYAPLPEEFSTLFNEKQANKTGIAWVNKNGNNWAYSRKINGRTVFIKGNNIYELHRKVKAQNLVWGIKDYNKARKIIKIPENFEIPNTKKQLEPLNKDIYAPLSEKHISKFNPNLSNKTGIAWVNKVGNNWTYQRQIDGHQIRFSSPDIHKLHKIVINNHEIWGIINFNKAKKIIDSPIENDEPIPNNTVTVTYIDKTQNEIETIIKGIINNNELIKSLNKLNLFENNIKRINTTSINNKIDLFIELEINKYMIHTFEEKIESLNWKINK